MAETSKRRRSRRQFDDEFKTQAVRLVLDEGKSVGAVARELDLTESALRNWVERARADRTHGKTGLTTAERDELARLRKENRILRATPKKVLRVSVPPTVHSRRGTNRETEPARSPKRARVSGFYGRRLQCWRLPELAIGDGH